MSKIHVQTKLNGEDTEFLCEPRQSLLEVLRETLGFTGTKEGCGDGNCGACSVQIDGVLANSCLVLALEADGKEITTIEAIGNTESGAKIQQAWLDIEVVQCGYCQSGQIMSAAALLESNPSPSDSDIDAAMSGNICRCGTYPRIRAAIKQASKST